jgi:biopolymer transport protein ExbD
VKPKRRSSESQGIYEPNMTPLIDVSLVLVVILMVATPLALQSAIAVGRTHSSGVSAEKAKEERVEVAVLSSDTIQVNRVRVPRAALGATLRPLIEASASREVVVRCADAVPHGAFVAVLDEARLQGATRIAVTGSSR